MKVDVALDDDVCVTKKSTQKPGSLVVQGLGRSNALKIAVGIARINGEASHHKLRHSFASELLRKGVNPKTVQELMRHSSIDTLFDHYAHVLRSDLAEAVERI